MGPAPSSTSPSPDVFAGVDPDYSEEITVGPAVLVVGPTAAGVWERVRFQVMLANQDAHRRAVKKLDALGLDPEAEVRKVGTITITAIMAELALDPILKVETREAALEAFRFSVRHHRGFVFKDGSMRPFSTQAEKVRGRSVVVVGEETMRFYEANPAIVDLVWEALKRINSFEDLEKKASPR